MARACKEEKLFLKIDSMILRFRNNLFIIIICDLYTTSQKHAINIRSDIMNQWKCLQKYEQNKFAY